MPAFPLVACVSLPLAANDWLDGLLPFLFFVIWIVSQVVGVVRRLGGGGKAEGRGVPDGGRPAGIPREVVRPPVVAEGERDPRAAQQADLQRQIEAFRRAQAEGGARGAPQNPPSLPQAPPRRVPAAGKPPAPVSARGQEGGVRRPPSPSRSTTPSARPGMPAANGPAAILGGHGGEIGRHVDGAFAHDLSHDRPAAIGRPVSGDQSAVAPQTVPKAAHDLVAMFRDPATIRQVILLREVLDRPIDRW